MQSGREAGTSTMLNFLRMAAYSAFSLACSNKSSFFASSLNLCRSGCSSASRITTSSSLGQEGDLLTKAKSLLWTFQASLRSSSFFTAFFLLSSANSADQYWARSGVFNRDEPSYS